MTHRTDMLIKVLRTRKGMTQKDLARGLCSRETLIRLEKGVHTPSKYLFESLMIRLGENPSKYTSTFVTVQDQHYAESMYQIDVLFRAQDADHNQQAAQLLDELAADEAFMSMDGHQQFVLIKRATLANRNKQYADMYTYAHQALCLSQPDFELSVFLEHGAGGLFYQEVWALNLMSVALYQQGDLQGATDILLGIVAAENLEEIYTQENVRSFIGVYYNLSKYSGQLDEHEACVRFADQGLQLCKQFDSYMNLPYLLHNKSASLYYLGKAQEAEQLLAQSTAYFKLDNDHEAVQINLEFAKQFNLKVSND